jgi:uncharacterized protein YkwD
VAREAGRLRLWLPQFIACALGAAACSVVLVPVPPAVAAGTASSCPHAKSRPDDATIPQLRRATLCLLNRERAAKGLDPLSRERHLRRIAKRHSKLMVAQECFDHVCSGEDSLPQRLKASGYLNGARKWAYAEDLGYETTPKQMVHRWLAMPYDRANLLNRKYVDVGIGLAPGAPSPSAIQRKFITYTVDLGWRKPPA